MNDKIKHEDLLILGKGYASANFSHPDWPTQAIVIFRRLDTKSNRSNYALESMNGPWTEDREKYASDKSDMAAVSVELMEYLSVVYEPANLEKFWKGRVWYR
jgi:hypothetical protein